MTRAEKKLLPPDLYSRNTVIAHLAQILSPNDQAKILDVGGRGAKLSWFFPESTQFSILDLAPKLEDDDVEYIQGDAQKIPFSDKNFDVVISTDMLEHVDKPFRAPVIREMLRVSKNYLIIGVPCGNGLIAKAEKHVQDQFKNITGREHPFLNEHSYYGLPKEEKIEEILNKEGVQFFKVKEGNLMSWYIQQLYAGVQHEQDITADKYKFYKFFNENLFELGNLRTPTYRTIFCIAKEGELQTEKALEELNSIHVWKPEKFMELLEMAFKDLRIVIDEKKNSLQEMETKFNSSKTRLAELEKKYEEVDARSEHTSKMLREREAEAVKQEEIIEKARKSLETYRAAIKETRNYLQEKEKTIQFLKNIVEQKDKALDELKQSEAAMQEKLNSKTELSNKLLVDLSKKTEDISRLKQHIIKNEHYLKGVKDQLGEVSEDLENHRRALQEVRDSRAWKLIMVYSKIKTVLWKKPKGLIKKGWKILTKLGLKVFIKRIIRKLKKQPELQVGQKPYDKYLEKNKLTSSRQNSAQKGITAFHYKPVISIIMPVYNVEEKWLEKAIKSVQNQWYSKWELCICDDASTEEHVKKVLEKFAAGDPRIKIKYRQHNGGIVKTTNDALTLATGAYIGFLDNDDELAENALYEVIKALQEAKYNLVYSDEDKLDENGKRCEPFFKPDWSPDLLLSQNYICHFAVYRKKILDKIGGLKEGYDGSQDYDLALRFTEKTQSIKHIPSILYHWRKIPGSAAGEVEAKPYAFESAKRALGQALKRRGIEGEVADGIWKGSYRVKRTISEEPLVSIIIPFKDQVGVLKACIDSIIKKTTYKNYEIILVNNRSELLETLEYLKTIKENERVEILEYDKPFNYSAINNFAAGKAKGEILILLNNDTEIITPDWIETMLEHAQRPEVGAVGAKLLFPNNSIQHAGVLIGIGGIANSSFLKNDKDDHCYFGQADVIKNYSAVTGACMMVRKDIYLRLKGLNEENLAVTFNDVDFCLRLREKGYLIVYTPYAQLYHHESLSRGYEVNLNEIKFMQRQHAGVIEQGDPYYNPNLTRERFDFSLRVEDKV